MELDDSMTTLCENLEDNNDQIHNAPEKMEISPQSSKDNEPQQSHLDTLSKYFGHTEFRPMQWQIINSILYEKRDTCCVMATGYGKSLCYQFPPIFNGGISIVISPLISLMEDQVNALEVSNIPACLLGSAQNKQKQVIDDLLNGVYRLVYLTPEFVTGECGYSLLLDLIKSQNVSLLAIDEAHCVSQWGHDFRHAYRDLGNIRDILPNIPILAVTATATDTVRKDIIKSLKLRDPQILCSSFDRPNLYFKGVKKSADPWADLSRVLKSEKKIFNIENGSVIIYCLTKKNTDTLVQLLTSRGIKCGGYHAGMSMKLRKSVQEQFVKDEIKIIVATIAFGMGIDKPNVRCVIHYGASSDMEGYYQEVGRAGRDGLPSLCILYHSPSDFVTHRFLREHSLQQDEIKSHKEDLNNIMRQYASTRECRRQFILSYFEKNPPSSNVHKSNCCDNCSTSLVSPNDHDVYVGIDKEGKYDFTEDGNKFLKVVDFLHPRTFGLTTIVSFLRGSKAKKLNPAWFTSQLHGIGKDKPDVWWKEVASVLEDYKYLSRETKRIATSSFQVLVINTRGREWMRNKHIGSGYKHILRKPSGDVMQCLETKEKKISPLFGSTKTSDNISIAAGPSERDVSSSTLTQATFFNSTMDYQELDENGETLLKELLYIRHSLAHSQNINPHTIVSDVALRQFALKLPTSIAKLKAGKFDGLSSIKIDKFGQHFVDGIKKAVLSNSNLVPTVSDLLKRYPLTDIKIKCGMSFMESLNLYNEGLTIQQIADKRKLVPSTIVDHLISALYHGYNLDVTKLPLYPDRVNHVITAIKTLNGDTSRLALIKSACPGDFTYEEIKLGLCYYNIRDHLSKLNIPYKDDYALCDGKFVSKIVNMDDDDHAGSNDLDLSKFAVQSKNVLKIDNASPVTSYEMKSNNCSSSGISNLDSGIVADHDISVRVGASLKSILEDVEMLSQSENTKITNDINSANVIISDPVDADISSDSQNCDSELVNKLAEGNEKQDSDTEDELDVLMMPLQNGNNDVKWEDDDILLQNINELDDIVDKHNQSMITDGEIKSNNDFDDSIILVEPSTSKDDIISINDSDSQKSITSNGTSALSMTTSSPRISGSPSSKLTSSAKKRAYINDTESDDEQNTRPTKRILPTWLLDASKNKKEKKKTRNINKLIF